MASTTLIERVGLTREGNLRPTHWVILGLSLTATAAGWFVAHERGERSIASSFEREAQEVVAHVHARMRMYADALWAGVVLHAAIGGEVAEEQWQAIAEGLHLQRRFPGLEGLGLVRVVPRAELAEHQSTTREGRPGYAVYPPHEGDECLPIVHYVSASGGTSLAGLDLAHEHDSRAAVEHARLTGEATITAPVPLVRDGVDTQGFFLCAPIFDAQGGAEEGTARRRFLGLVVAPFVMSELMDGALARDGRHVTIKITDSGEVLYDEQADADPEADPMPLHTTTLRTSLYGRSWTFDLESDAGFRAAHRSLQPLVVLLGGTTISALLFGVFFLWTRSQKSTLGIAERVERELETRNDHLQRENLDLERFAYAATHDLRTPLRGIRDLVEYLEEDLEAYLAAGDANPDVERNLERINEQVVRMDALVRGVLDYTTIEMREKQEGTVTVGPFVLETATKAGLREDQVVVETGVEEFETDVSALGEVLGHLLDNAVKHHHDHENARVGVGVRAEGSRVLFKVTDDGPGIEPRHHARIFEAFQTLRPWNASESSGIGLSIAKRIVRNHGGSLTVDSAPNHGATFSFDWPIRVEASSLTTAAEARE